jgi:hypothetical protein
MNFQLKQKYLILEENFEGDWPVAAILQVLLKNASAKATR